MSFPKLPRTQIPSRWVESLYDLPDCERSLPARSSIDTRWSIEDRQHATRLNSAGQRLRSIRARADAWMRGDVSPPPKDLVLVTRLIADARTLDLMVSPPLFTADQTTALMRVEEGIRPALHAWAARLTEFAKRGTWGELWEEPPASADSWSRWNGLTLREIESSLAGYYLGVARGEQQVSVPPALADLPTLDPDLYDPVDDPRWLAQAKTDTRWPATRSQQAGVTAKALERLAKGRRLDALDVSNPLEAFALDGRLRFLEHEHFRLQRTARDALFAASWGQPARLPFQA